MCFVVLLAFHFLHKKRKLPTFPKILGFCTCLLRFLGGRRVFKYEHFKISLLCLQKIFYKNSNLEIHLYMLVFHFKAAFPQPWKCGSRFGCRVPPLVAINIADTRAVLPSELELVLLNNLSLETRQLENVGAHSSVICSGDPTADQLLVCSVPGCGGWVSMLPPTALCACRAV